MTFHRRNINVPLLSLDVIKMLCNDIGIETVAFVHGACQNENAFPNLRR